ncbi:MAG: alpha/beta hydrolase [Aerococcus sp.]|nr:alpha/beta hydrolase [Aerococcus sp.]
MSPYTLTGENHRAVLLLHAYASNSVDHNLLAKGLNRAGYTVKTINFTGHGTGKIEDVLAATPEDWTADGEQALRELREMADIDGITVFGLSLGGIVATRLLIDDKSLVGGGNFSSPVMQQDATDSHVPDAFLSIAENQLQKRQMDRKVVDEQLLALRPQVISALNQISAYSRSIQADLKYLHQPYFVASAGHDEMINYHIVDEIVDVLKDQVPVTHHHYPESKHAMTVGRVHKQLQEDVLAFLDQCDWK